MSSGNRSSGRVDGLSSASLNLIALAGAVTWGLVALLGRPAGDYGVETDFYGDFVRYARQWMQGEPTVMNGYRGPFYYLTLGALSTLLGDAFLAAKLISAAAAAAGIRLLGGLLGRLWNPTVGIAGALFVAGSPMFVRYPFRACTDLLYWVLIVGTITLLVAQDRQRIRSWALAGILAGAAYLTRYNGLSLVLAALLTAAISVRPLTRAGWAFLAFLGTWLLVTAPWALFLWQQTGDPLWSNAFQNVAIQVFVTHPTIAHDGQFTSSVGFATLAEVWKVDPSRFVRMLGGNLVDHIWKDANTLVGLPWAAAALLGVVLNARSWLTRDRLAFAAAGLSIYASTIPVFYNTRFMLPLLPWWAAGVGGLVSVIAGRLRSLRRRGAGITIPSSVARWSATAALAVVAVAAN